jgi:DNA-binding LacI/PurR family transcriptional regulator
MKKKVTIIDLARKLNMAKSTVSRALNDHPRISEETKRAVRELAQKLEFLPNTMAVGLSKQKSFIIGVIVPGIVNHFFASVIDGIEDVAYQEGYKVIICKSDESYEREVINTSALASQRVDGLLVSLSMNTKNTDHLASARKKGIPVVLFDRVSHDLKVSKVYTDDVAGAFEAVDFLIRSGYKRIAHLAGPSGLLITQSRMKGYTKALKKHQLSMPENYVVAGDMSLPGGKDAMLQLLELPVRPQAVFCANDQMAIGAMQVIKAHKLKVPDDIALVGFSNEPVTAIANPPLTTVHQPAFDVGREACRLLIQELESKKKPQPTEIVLKTKLVERQSTAKRIAGIRKKRKS